MEIDLGKLKSEILALMREHPDNYVQILHAKCYRNKYESYIQYINESTSHCLNDPYYKFITKLYWVMNDIKTFPLCPYCKKPITRNVVSGIKGYSSPYCNQSCMRRDIPYKEKMKRIAREKYGCDSIIASKQVREKIEASVKKRIEENPDFYSIRANKSRETCMMKYGVPHPQQVDEIKKRTLITYKKNNLEKFGVEFPLQNKDIMNKIKKANRLKYGTDFPLQNYEYQKKLCQMARTEESKKKRLRTAIQRYGVSNLFHIGMSKAILSIHKNSYNHLFSTTTLPLFSFDEYLEYIKIENNSTPLHWKCLECGNNFQMVPFQHYYRGSWVRCTKCHPFISFGFSGGEKDVLEYVKTIIPDVVVKENDNSIIRSTKTGRPLELDIWIPELKCAIEYQGEYQHTLNKTIENDAIKRTVCKKKHIKLFQLDETVWKNDNETAKLQIRRFLLNETSSDNKTCI